ncbi:MAG: uncharacterized protein QOF21_2939 [Actinomycetota bacterium]|jgi:predicted  nucleic acid-binding Zn-ribbon protein
MTTALNALLSLQDHDVAIDQLKRKLAQLPERAAAHALNERRHADESRLHELSAELDALAAEEATVEADLAVVETRAKSLDEGLRSPGSATRDAQAIIHEIDHLKERAGALEERGLELLEQRDVIANERARVQAGLDEIASEAPKVLAAVATAEGDAARELATLEAERAEAAGTVDAALMDTYERLRARLDGVAVARVVNGSCTGCHLALSSADLEQMAKLGPDGHMSCEQCGRILIPT